MGKSLTDVAEDAVSSSPKSTATVAPSDGLPSQRHDLVQVLNGLPFGLRVEHGQELVFCNAIGNQADQQECDEPTLVRRSFDFTIKEGVYTAFLFLDETEQTRREQALIRRAYFDELTGLPNRRLVEQSIRSLIESGGAPFAIAFLDVDSFKHINDFYGHAAGDQLLIEMSKRISMTLRPSDMVARLGGDEFLVLLSPVDSSDHVSTSLTEMLERVGRPYFIDNSEILSTASVGVSQYPQDGMSYSDLQSNADRAMYRSKSTGRGLIQFFDETIEHSVIDRTKLEQRLRLAIRDRRISCAYQPKVNLHSGDIYGVEVLMRWIDEDGTIQPPGEFIGLAVELGLLDNLTFLLFEKTTDAIDRINEAFGETVSISINVAAKQAGDIVFMRALLAMVSDTGFASRFILEITEEAFVSKSLFQESVLPLIREVGARVSIDDFGVGYSSLSALANITADELKVDRSFITNVHQRPRSQNVLKAIEALSYSLGMDVVVEGIETIEELMYLRTFTGIKHAQGFYFSKAILLEDINIVQRSAPRSASVARHSARSR